MIRVQIWRRLGRPVRYRLSGHAGAGAYGEDIVCAAVSALAQAALIGLEEHLGLEPVVELDEEQGLLDVRLPHLVEGSRAEQGSVDIIETMRLGIESIARSYPGRIRIEQERVRDGQRGTGW